MWAVNWKRQKVLLTAALSPCLNSGVHIFIQCLRLNESDRSGLRFCLCRQSPVLCRIDWGHRDHKEQSSDEHGDNKSPPRTLIPSVAIQKEKKKQNNGGWARSLRPTESSGIFNPMSLNLICAHRRWDSLAVWASASLSFSSSCIKQKGIKQLQAKVSTQLGILSSHKVLLQRLTVTFTGSENPARGVQCLFKTTQTLYGAFREDLVE